MTSGIYCIENIKNNKKYIGQSKCVEKRILRHFTNLSNNHHCNKHLLYSFEKHGKDMFHGYLIIECKKDELNKMEQLYIAKYDTTNPAFGYNILIGGSGTKGRIVSQETRMKISAAGKGRIYSKERNLKISISKKGIPKNIPTEQRNKIIIANTGKKIKTRKTTSSYLGVSYCSRDKTWSAYLKGSRIGSFKNEIDAAKAFDNFSWKILHDSSKLNFKIAGEL